MNLLLFSDFSVPRHTSTSRVAVNAQITGEGLVKHLVTGISKISNFSKIIDLSCLSDV